MMYVLFVSPSPVLPGPGSASGASYYGVGATGQRSGHLSSGRHAVFARIFLGQGRRLHTQKQDTASHDIFTLT